MFIKCGDIFIKIDNNVEFIKYSSTRNVILIYKKDDDVLEIGLSNKNKNLYDEMIKKIDSKFDNLVKFSDYIVSLNQIEAIKIKSEYLVAKMIIKVNGTFKKLYSDYNDELKMEVELTKIRNFLNEELN